MKINDDHMYHGAALTQIAEHELFTSINAVKFDGHLSRSAFRVNEDIGIYIKYAGRPTGSDYIFTFTNANKTELARLMGRCDNVHLALVCVKDRQVCCISLAEFEAWLENRRVELGRVEATSTILVNLPIGKAFRVNMNQPGRRKIYLDNPQIVPRNRFPNILFG